MFSVLVNTCRTRQLTFQHTSETRDGGSDNIDNLHTQTAVSWAEWVSFM